MYNPQLETFLCVAECGSFNKAAEKLFISPPAVIKQINLLEENLNLQLFVRTHRGLQLTEAGKSLAQDAKYIIQYCKDSVTRAKNVMKKSEDIIRIGTSSMTPAQVLVDLWPKLQKECPGVKFQLVPFDNTPENAREILANLGQNIDVIAGIFDETMLNLRRCAGLEISREPICAAVSIHHRLAGKDRLTVQDLYGEKFMMMRREYATLNNGIKMPMAGIGTFLLTPDEAEASVLSALQCGYRLIDTANAYVNEKAVGRAMRKSGIPRDEIFLETKLWPSFYEQEDAVEKTLQRLGTGYIDLLLIHQPAGNYVAGYRLMEKAYKEGKVRAIGLSNFTPEQVQEILDICEVKPAVLQTEVHPYSQEKELKAFLDKEGIVIQAWYPLGHGDKALIQEPLFTEFGKKYGKSNAQIILRWHIQAGNIVIPGSKNPAHIKENFNLFDFALTDDEMGKITALDKQKRYYTSTPEMLKKYAEMVPPVDEQK